MQIDFIEKKLIELSQEAIKQDEVPVACIVEKEEKIVSFAFNGKKRIKHAEMIAMELAMEVLNTNTLHDCNIYVSLEPCPMCAYAMVLARIKKLYFFALDDVAGAIISNQNIFESFSYKPKWEYIKKDIFKEMLKDFFKSKRRTCDKISI